MDAFVDSLRRLIDGPRNAYAVAMLEYLHTCAQAAAGLLARAAEEKRKGELQ